MDYADNALRFAALSAAAIDWQARQPEPPHVVHAHDWQAGLTPVYLRQRGGPGVVFTIHNLAYQGNVDKDWVPRLGLSWADFTVAGFEFYDRLSFLKAGVSFADEVTTVSPTYAEEIQRPEYGYGFDGVMRARRDHLTGILNGIDTSEWDPAKDPFLPEPFDATDLAGKRAAKRALLELCGLPVDDESLARPVIGMVSRMVDQKGLDLIAALAGDLPSLDATFTIVGTGETRYQDMWRALAAWRPDRVSAFIGYDERRAHLIEAGADVFMMPSRYEPCGLNQMAACATARCRWSGPSAASSIPSAPQPAERPGTGFPSPITRRRRCGGRSRRRWPSTGQPRLAAAAVERMRKDFSWTARPRVRQGV